LGSAVLRVPAVARLVGEYGAPLRAVTDSDVPDVVRATVASMASRNFQKLPEMRPAATLPGMDDLTQSLAAGEDAHTELKSSLSDWRKIVETVAAMATAGGGTILVGVRPDGTLRGIDLGEGRLEQLIQRVLSNTDPRVFIEVDCPVLEGKTLLRIAVPPGDGPHLAFGRAFHRPGPATVRMTRDEYERRLLDRLRESSGYERRAAPACELDEIDAERLARFVVTAAPRGAEAGDPAGVLGRLKLLSDGRPTVGAMLLFGADPQGPFPQAVIRGRVTRGAVTEASDVLSAEGTLFDQIEAALRFVQRNLRTRVVIDDLHRQEVPELPAAAWRHPGRPPPAAGRVDRAAPAG